MDSKKVVSILFCLIVSICLFNVTESSFISSVPSIMIPSAKTPKQNLDTKYMDKKINSTNIIKQLLEVLQKQPVKDVSNEFKQAVEELWKNVMKKSRPIYGR